ncbi:MAG: hypothetical protein COB98_07155 [Flavobacteriaceae bacterium]|nr:MAG: hypothetical protein COB98_07155 [Flavobacteriaceae bacterium]
MQTKINERENTILSFKPTLKEDHKGLEKRIRKLKISVVFNLIVTSLAVGAIIVSILLGLFDYEFLIWEKSALLVLLSVSFMLNLPNQWYELKLSKHLKNINSISDFKGLDALNLGLKILIEKINNRWKNAWIELVLGVIIMLMVFVKMIYDSNNPYWNYMKLPVVLFYGIVLVRFMSRNKKLNENIKETEKYCA